MLLLRIANAVLLPPLGVWLLYIVWRHCSLRTRFGALTAWLLPIVACVAVIATYNWVRFGTILETGYADQAHAFDTPLYVGVYGLLFSSGKSLFVYAPILLASVVAWFRLRRVRWLLAALVLMYLVFYARYDWWYGGGPWGPRFMAVILPFVCLPLATLGARSRLAWLSLAALAALSVGIQLLSILVPYLPYEAVMAQDDANYERLLFHPAYSPVLVHVRALLHHTYPPDLAFSYYPLVWLGAVQAALLLAAAGVLITGVRRLAPKRTEPERPCTIQVP
jgi:hypothetical protein